MTHLARHDLLTNLPNRGLLLDRVEHALQMSRRRGTRIALLFVDLDGFKPVNDRFGHAAGDAVLIDFAQRLHQLRPARATPSPGSAATSSRSCSRTCTRPRSARRASGSSPPCPAAPTWPATSSPCRASVGVAFGDRSETAESMLRNADLAMYEAKSRGKNQLVEYERAIGRSRLQRLELVESLRASVAAGDLTLVYQPVVRASTGTSPASRRWPGGTPTASTCPRTCSSGWPRRAGSSCPRRRGPRPGGRGRAAMLEAAGGDLNISVNISAKQLREPDFVGQGASARIDRMGGHHAGARDHRARHGRRRPGLDRGDGHARRPGVPFAIDDFGVGFSSIGYLQDMPVQIIKTDASFSEGIDRDERSCALLCSITMMGQALGLDVVIEGIERASQLDHLRDHVHAPFAQGYLMHRPMPLDAAGAGARGRTAACRRRRRGGQPRQRPGPGQPDRGAQRLAASGSALGERPLLDHLSVPAHLVNDASSGDSRRPGLRPRSASSAPTSSRGRAPGGVGDGADREPGPELAAVDEEAEPLHRPAGRRGRCVSSSSTSPSNLAHTDSSPVNSRAALPAKCTRRALPGGGLRAQRLGQLHASRRA